MKLLVTFKDPDALSESIERLQAKIEKDLTENLKLSKNGAEVESAERMSVFDNILKEYFQYGEYVTLELDSVTNTIRVCSNRETE